MNGHRTAVALAGPRSYKYAISYGRFSSAKQIEGHSKERQDEAREDALARYGWTLLKTYFDPSTSGGRGKHSTLGKLGELRRQIKRKIIPTPVVLIIEAFDRLSRQRVMKALEIYVELINRGVAIYTTMDDGFYDAESIKTNPGQLYMSVSMMQGASGVHEGMKDRSVKGWVKRRPLITKNRPAWLTIVEENGVKQFQPRPGAQELIERIFVDCQSMGYDAVARRLNEAGIKPFPAVNRPKPRNFIWLDQTIRKMISGRAVRGELRLGFYKPVTREVEVDGEQYEYDVSKRYLTGQVIKHYPEMISETLWDETNLAVSKRSNKNAGNKGVDFPNLLQGLARCAHCGAAMSYQRFVRPTQLSIEYITCSNRRRGGCKQAERFRYEEAEQAFIEQIIPNIGDFVRNRTESDTILRLRQEIADSRAALIKLDARQAVLEVMIKEAAAKGGQGDAAMNMMMDMFDHNKERTALLTKLSKQERALHEAEHTPHTSEQVTELTTLTNQISRKGADAYALRAKVNTRLRTLVERVDFISTSMSLAVAFHGQETPIWIETYRRPAKDPSRSAMDHYQWVERRRTALATGGRER